MRAFVLILVAIAFAFPFAWARWSRARRAKRREEQLAADRELTDLLDEWNRKHRPDFWARGGEWPEGKNSGAEKQQIASTYA